jgi:hypothetical protein
MKLPDPNVTDAGTQNYLRLLVKTLTAELARKMESRTAVDSVLLVSPNRSVYSVQVSDAGVLSTTKLFEG